MEDYLELQDPKVRKHIRSSHEEFLARKHKSAEVLLSELKRGSRRRPSRRGQTPGFKNESEEADWWAGPAGRAYVKQRSAEASSKGAKARGSGLVAKLNEKGSVQIAIRLPATDLARARKVADRKGIGYQTLMKMLVHEGLAREARRR